jgi:hypothetical protein
VSADVGRAPLEHNRSRLAANTGQVDGLPARRHAGGQRQIAKPKSGIIVWDHDDRRLGGNIGQRARVVENPVDEPSGQPDIRGCLIDFVRRWVFAHG